MVALISSLSGCENSPAPEPVENPNPAVYLHIKVKVESSVIDDLRVNSVWAIRNFGCAPIEKFTGHMRVGTPNVPEKVTKVAAGEYVVDVRKDRYIDDTCHWRLGGLQFNFMHGPEVFSSYVVTPEELEEQANYEIVCLPKTRWTGTCVEPKYLNATELSRSGKFKGFIEVLP